MPFRGFIESSTPDHLAGWAVDDAGAPCDLTLRVNERTTLTLSSELPRPDLVKVGRSLGQGGFKFSLEGMLDPGPNLLELFFPDGTEVPGSPVRFGARSDTQEEEKYDGYLESCEKGELKGWAVTGAGTPCRLSILVNKVEREAIFSEGPRPDLARGGRSLGLGGFSVNVEPHLIEPQNEIAVILPDGTPLRGSPVQIVRRDVRAQRTEAAGKPRTAKAESEAAQPAVVNPVPYLDKDKAIGESVDFSPHPADPASAEPPPAVAPPSAVDVADADPPEGRTGNTLMPSLTELDELSLDDLSLAVAGGLITVEAPPAPAPVEMEAPAPEAPSAETASRKPSGWLARLLGRS